MATPQRIAAEDQELVTFAQARRILGGISAGDFANLMVKGHLIPHPILTDRINHEHVKEFARLSGTGAETNGRRAVPDAATQSGGKGEVWGVPTLDQRRNAG